MALSIATQLYVQHNPQHNPQQQRQQQQEHARRPSACWPQASVQRGPDNWLHGVEGYR